MACGNIRENLPYSNFHDMNQDWLIRTVREVTERVEALEGWKAAHEDEYMELKSFYDNVIAGNFPSSIQEAFRTWMRRNAVSLVGELVKNVFFGITDAGYFVAYIPESWNDIIFNTTGLDITISGIEDGRLILSY